MNYLHKKHKQANFGDPAETKTSRLLINLLPGGFSTGRFFARGAKSAAHCRGFHVDTGHQYLCSQEMQITPYPESLCRKCN